MPTPRSCVRCLSPLADLPPGGVCPVCGSAVELVDTAAVTPAGPDTPAAVPETPAYIPADPFGPTPTAAPASAATAVLDGDRPRAARLPALPNYDVLKPVGAGGMGVVYQAIQKRVGRLVALKVIQGHGGLDARQRARFQNEAEALGRLAHPNVVTVYDVGEEDGTPYYAMEFVPGGTLADRVRDGGRVPPAEAAGLVAAAAAGVAAAHRVGVLHRDLKPSNLLVAADGTVKVGDFGLAKLLDRDDGPTHTGQVVGTPSYMAPEQAGGAADIGPHTDVYGLGATLYHLLTGRPPFKEETPMGTAVRVLNEAPPAPRQVRPDLCPVLEAIVLKAMAKAPAARYPSARALADDLARWRRGEPTSVRPPTRWQTTAGWVRERRRAILAAAVLVLVAAAGWGVQVGVDAWRREAARREIEQTLSAGRPVTLVGETGPPKWFRWELGAVTPAESILGDGTFGFQTHDLSLLELVADPMHDRFRFAAEFRHLRPGNPGTTSVGLFVGLDPVPADRGRRAARWVGIEFSDYWRAGEKDDAELRSRHGLQAAVYTTTRGDTTGVAYTDLGVPFPFPPAAASPNPWRAVVVDVTPDGIRIEWRPTAGNPGRAVTVSAEDVRARSRGTAPPAWQPRRPVGLYARDAAAAFRNVTVTPTPTP